MRSPVGIIRHIWPLALAAILLVASFSSAYAGEGSPRDLSGTVFIKGDVNDVSWDDMGISRWEAKGNVYLRFTSTEGEIVELYGDYLLYEKRDVNGAPRHWTAVKDNAKLLYANNNINAGGIEGFLEPLKFDISSGVELHTEQFDISCEDLSLYEIPLLERELPLYNANILGKATGTFRRAIAEPKPPPETTATLALPLPVDFRPDFKRLDFESDGMEIKFDDDGLVSASFQSGGKAVTDTGYVFTGDTLTFDGWTEIDAFGCRITGQDAVITCREMSFFPADKRLELEGDVTLSSNEGAMHMDSLEICYDDNGVSELCARGNIKIDLTITFGEDISKAKPVSQNKPDDYGP